MLGILAGGLAEAHRAAFDVEDVVDDLEREPDRFGEGVERGIEFAVYCKATTARRQRMVSFTPTCIRAM